MPCYFYPLFGYLSRPRRNNGQRTDNERPWLAQHICYPSPKPFIFVFNLRTKKTTKNIPLIRVLLWLYICPGAGHGGRQKINGLQQRKDFHPRCKREHSKCLQEAVPVWFGRVSKITIAGDEKWWVHVPGLLGEELCGPHGPRRGWPPLRDPLSGCLGWSCARGNHIESFPIFQILISIRSKFYIIFFLLTREIEKMYKKKYRHNGPLKAVGIFRCLIKKLIIFRQNFQA